MSVEQFHSTTLMVLAYLLRGAKNETGADKIRNCLLSLCPSIWVVNSSKIILYAVFLTSKQNKCTVTLYVNVYNYYVNLYQKVLFGHMNRARDN